MKVRARLIAATAALALVAAVAPSATGTSPNNEPVEVTSSPKGRDMAVQAAERYSNLGRKTLAADLKVWRIGPDDYLIGEQMPDSFKTTVTKGPDDSTDLGMSYNVGFDGTGIAAQPEIWAAAAAPSWAFLDSACFSRMGDSTFGFLDSCYSLHKLINETNTKDFYKLEQYGTLGAGNVTKIYSGWLNGVKASTGSSAMSWVDWAPRANVTGGCQNLTLRIEALGVGFTTPAFFCEQNTPTKYAAAGSFRMEWNCGCVYPFGQPYPNSREIDYLQSVSVDNGGSVMWTLSAGYNAR